MRNLVAGVVIVIILGIAVFLFTQNESRISQQNTMPAPTQKNTKNQASTPKLEIDTNKIYQAVLHTSEGDITIEFTPTSTPVTINNFISLAKKGYYNNTNFHRVMKGFMIQGGDPKGDGTGGPGYQFADEPFEGEYTKGVVAMANAGPDTNGSQFFIMHEDYDLPKNYTIFGKVVDGLDVVDKIAEAKTHQSMGSGENSTPDNPVVISSITVTEK